MSYIRLESYLASFLDPRSKLDKRINVKHLVFIVTLSASPDTTFYFYCSGNPKLDATLTFDVCRPTRNAQRSIFSTPENSQKFQKQH